MNITVIAASTAQPWRMSPTMRPNAKHSAAGIRKIDSICEEVRQRRRVLVRVRRVGVEEAAAVGAEHLDRLLRGDRAHGQRLRVGAQSSITGSPLASFSGCPSAPFLGSW